ncbi:MAG: hypothetical protein OEX00_00755 [Gammaproteobacteria bacterium]|nr:hypothetical protein [Gammaproteobacteria bacterium]MDH5694737.1 hypothetical protein [Gammaproteobacteria bacterium]
MSTAKDQIKQILDSQPEDSSYEDLLREIAFKRMVDKGMLDAKSGNVVSNEEMERIIKGWQK